MCICSNWTHHDPRTRVMPSELSSRQKANQQSPRAYSIKTRTAGVSVLFLIVTIATGDGIADN